MKIEKSYITDEKGNIRSVIIDYKIYKMIEDAILDRGLLNAMEEIRDEETVAYEDVREVIKHL